MANEGSTGRAWRIYRNTNTFASPSWTAVTERKDISLTITKDEIESLRDGSEFKEYLKGYKDMAVSFGIKYTRNNANHVAFRTDFFLDTDAHFDLLILDGAVTTSGAQGIRMVCALFQFDHAAALTEESEVELSFKPTYAEESGSAIVSDWYTVS